MPSASSWPGRTRALQQIGANTWCRTQGHARIYGCLCRLTIEISSQFLYEPAIAVDVAGYNSKVYYVIFDQGTAGQLINRMPITGNETVLDAVSGSGTRGGTGSGLAAGANVHRIWVARRSSIGEDCHVLPVDWNAIVRGGSTATNYQLLPGDRVYVGLDPWIRTDQYIAKMFSPIERLLGVTLLGHSVVNAIGTPIGSNTGGVFR